MQLMKAHIQQENENLSLNTQDQVELTNADYDQFVQLPTNNQSRWILWCFDSNDITCSFFSKSKKKKKKQRRNNKENDESSDEQTEELVSNEQNEDEEESAAPTVTKKKDKSTTETNPEVWIVNIFVLIKRFPFRYLKNRLFFNVLFVKKNFPLGMFSLSILKNLAMPNQFRLNPSRKWKAKTKRNNKKCVSSQ